jgi:hypothetical protein
MDKAGMAKDTRNGILEPTHKDTRAGGMPVTALNY